MIEPRFLLRPGPTDRVLLDRLLTPDLFTDAVKLDGLLIDAPLVSAYSDLRPRLGEDSLILVDPQAYRLQHESFLDQPSLNRLPYSPAGRTLTPRDYEDQTFVSQFVRESSRRAAEGV